MKKSADNRETKRTQVERNKNDKDIKSSAQMSILSVHKDKSVSSVWLLQ